MSNCGVRCRLKELLADGYSEEQVMRLKHCSLDDSSLIDMSILLALLLMMDYTALDG